MNYFHIDSIYEYVVTKHFAGNTRTQVLLFWLLKYITHLDTNKILLWAVPIIFNFFKHNISGTGCSYHQLVLLNTTKSRLLKQSSINILEHNIFAKNQLKYTYKHT
jgi:hypothetical protein